MEAVEEDLGGLGWDVDSGVMWIRLPGKCVQYNKGAAPFKGQKRTRWRRLSFTQQIFTEGILCARHCARPLEFISEPKFPALMRLIFQHKMDNKLQT